MGTRAERLEWTRGDGLVAVGAAATDLTGLSLSAVVDGTPFTVTGALGLVLAALTLLFRRHHPLPVLGAVLTLGLVVNVATPAAPHFGLTLTVALFTVGRRCRPAAVAAAGLATVPLAAVGLGGSLIPSGLRAGEEAESAPPAPQPGTADLQRIVTESRLAGMDTEFTVHGTVRPLPPTVGLTVFRVVQEALTNARKHAGNANARVRLTYRPQEVSVEVCDDGPGDGPPRRTPARPRSGRAGYGLIGMRERVALHGGTLEAAPREDGGFRVAARLPVPAAAGAPDGAEREDHRR
ncbi:sensor histidine kinase [Streptomyces sp. NPDC127112]|uniref:sensor histidine kinase n=1 Tax=Streptomyces sp. NPDC127112 TaxID=3345364 RepID=UPI0036287F1C